MNQHWTSNVELAEYVDGTLADDAVSSRTHHLADCDGCREELARFHEGLLQPVADEEAGRHKRHAAKSGKDLMASISRRIEGDRPNAGFLPWLRPRRLVWALPVLVLAFVLLRPGPSGRDALDSLYIEAAEDFPAWTGSPGRLIQPFREAPAEPLRSAPPGSAASDAELQRIEDALLQLDLPRASEDAERLTAVATLRLARGETESAWEMLRAVVEEHPSEESLTAYACAALQLGDDERLRIAQGALARSRWADDERIGYNRVLLLVQLDELGEATELFEDLQQDLGADDPWVAQLRGLLR